MKFYFMTTELMSSCKTYSYLASRDNLQHKILATLYYPMND